MISDAEVLAGIPQKVLYSLPTKEEKLVIQKQEKKVSLARSEDTVEPITCQPDLLALDPDLVQEMSKRERQKRRKVI